MHPKKPGICGDLRSFYSDFAGTGFREREGNQAVLCENDIITPEVEEMPCPTTS
jgi:hypothetical protein